MWGEAALTATFIMNRVQTRVLKDNKTPAELWYGKKPCLDNMRLFGCKAYAWIPSQKRHKLDSKSQECMMIGYAPNGYRL